MIEPDKLTKTDFLLYLESPLHFWAAKHGKLKQESPDSPAASIDGTGAAGGNTRRRVSCSYRRILMNSEAR